MLLLGDNGLSALLQPEEQPVENDFARIKRLPPYVFNITADLKAAARRRG